MEKSRLNRYAKQGEPQAIASFLGNHLARFNVWVIATPDRHCLNLSVESLEPPSPEEIMPSIEQLLYELQPENVELVKISARHYGELQVVWQKTFLMSEIALDEGNDLSEAITTTTATSTIKQTETFTSSAQLAIAINETLKDFNVAARVIEQKRGTLRIELRGQEVPKRADCLMVIYELLQYSALPEMERVHVMGSASRQVAPDWNEKILLEDLQPNRKQSFYEKIASMDIEEEFWIPLGIGLFVGALMFAVPLFDFAFSAAGRLIYDFGQAIGYSLMGYLPMGIVNPFEGGGVLANSVRSPLLFGCSYALWGLLLFLGRRKFFVIFAVVMMALWHGLIYQSTILTELFLGVSGQLTLWGIASILFYCALGGYSCRNQGERSLYMVFGTFFMFHHLEMYWQAWQENTANGLDWGALLGIALTLTLPYLTYRIFDANKPKKDTNEDSATNPPLQVGLNV
ncbi:hypothetical protein Lepto7376_0377 [[Leptolyngbya] sp. PCC 7376]|uniref:MFS transporter n=1 Tax=[Leptolyngbya] sp. PCC 7376 TaxID=111781 RepID=UPI00029EE346|nr:MFS transporter [[Leptolyngbya] sp. PCC 7376]AFY36815.1 hypothetical protein Lepto7376_0377 [[Leptolyngbya] sp. PCC 7376]